MAKLKPINWLFLGKTGIVAMILVALALHLWIPRGLRTTLLMIPATANRTEKTHQANARAPITTISASANRGGTGKPSLTENMRGWDQIREDLTNPQTRLIRRQRFRIQIEMKYGRLFRRLAKLDPEKLEQLKSLLTDGDLNQMLASLPTDAELANSQSPQISQRIEANQSETDTQIKNLLGGDEYANFTAYMDSRAYEETLGRIVNIMQAQGTEVSEAQQQAILDAYGSAMKQLGQAIADDPNQTNGPPAPVAGIETQRASDMARFDQILADTMSKALPPDLFTQFMDAQYAEEDASR